MSSEAANTASMYFLNKGYTAQETAAIVGNLQIESQWKLDAKGDYRNGNPTAFGIAQWRGDRVDNFKKIFGVTPDKAGLEQQLYFVDWELNNTHSSAREALKRATSVEQATQVFMRQYENPSYDPNVNHINKRISAAIGAYNNVASGSLNEKLSDAAKQAIRSIPGGSFVLDGFGIGGIVGDAAKNKIEEFMQYVPRIVAIVAGIALIIIAIAALTLKSNSVQEIVQTVKP